MGDFEQFLQQQEIIYAKFRGIQAEVRLKGTKPLPFITREPLGGYIIALRHPLEIVDKRGRIF